MKRAILQALIMASIVFAAAARAQDPSGEKAAMTACGIPSAQFSVTIEPARVRSIAVSSGRATIYFVSDFLMGVNSGTVRIGVDGEWIGALKANSYTKAEVTSGAHHFCAQGQGHLIGPDSVALFGLDVKAGQTYYFLVDTDSVLVFQPMLLGLAEINPDEGRLLVSKARLAVSTPKPANKHR